MVYIKFTLEWDNELILKSLFEIFRTFKEYLDEEIQNGNCRYAHFSPYGQPVGKRNEPALIKIKFDCLEARGIETKVFEIAKILKSRGLISDYQEHLDAVNRPEWLMLAHHLASECILKLGDSSNYYELVGDKPYTNTEIRKSFGPSFINLTSPVE